MEVITVSIIKGGVGGVGGVSERWSRGQIKHNHNRNHNSAGATKRQFFPRKVRDLTVTMNTTTDNG